MRTVTTLFVKLDSYSPEKHKNLLSLQVRHRITMACVSLCVCVCVRVHACLRACVSDYLAGFSIHGAVFSPLVVVFLLVWCATSALHLP